MARVLVVEDDLSILMVVSDALLAEGHVVESVSNGQEALLMMRGQRPDVVLTDLMMPVVDGWALVAVMRDDPLLSQIPVVVFSAHRAARETAAALGVEWCLTKPFDLPDLLEAIAATTQVRAA